MYRIWDCFLYEGTKVLFRFAMGILKLHEKKILQLEGSGAIFNYMKSMTNRLYDVEELVRVIIFVSFFFPKNKLKKFDKFF